MSKRSTRVNFLLMLLSYARPSGSMTELAFRERFIESIPGAYLDDYSNIHVAVGESRTLFSCHTDTVARHEGRQTFNYRGGTVGLSKRAKRSGFTCLGADDTAGIFVMIEMIGARVPGHYVFHHAEECGGIGSFDLSQHESEWLSASFDHAVAFDRRGTADVITRQGTRCCSDSFAQALATQLNRANVAFDYAPSPYGLFTDTANYADIIPECTNLSVGYYHEHTSAETLDVDHVLALSDAAQRIDWSALPVDRDPIAEQAERVAHWASIRALGDRENGRERSIVIDMNEYLTDDDYVEVSPRSYALDPEWEEVQRALERLERETQAVINDAKRNRRT